MKIRQFGIFSILFTVAAGISIVALSNPVLAVGPDGLHNQTRVDDRQDPLTMKQRALHETAMEAMLNGKAYGKTHEVARGQYVELARQGEDPVWTVMGEFADFSHNSIAEPDRNVDNSTIWMPDFNQGYFQEMLFTEGKGVNSMRQFYIENSSNRYAVYGDVTDWVPLTGNACDYDDGDPGPGNAFSVWQFLIDSIDGWYDAQIADGKTPAQINEYLSDYDLWDRYDYNGNGNFDEPDGYIDHMQFVHAGEGNEAGGGALGDCAIWSHSWYAYSSLPVGPAGNPSGGVKIGGSDYWVGKYTIQPENGGVGVFAHEYGHDLGLPDLYDYTGANSTGFWTAMSSGSWLSQNDYDIGSQPNHFGVWEKFQLGWLNYEVAYAASKSQHKLGPAETNTKQAQGLFVVLPPKGVTEDIGPPYAGDYYYYSGAGHNLDHMMYQAFSLPAGATLKAMVNYQIEIDWDYAYLVVSTDSGANWQYLETDHSTTSNPNGQNFGYGITGSSGDWVELNANLPAGDVLVGFQYWTDGNTGGFGFKVDNIEITGQPIDGAESDAGWTYAPAGGFRVTNGIESAYYNNYYVAEFRQYRGFDAGLENAYNFGWRGDGDEVDFNWVERFPYQDGLLINYWDTSFANNNVGANCASGRCGGLLLPVDAHPELMYRHDGGIWRNRVQTYDSTFGLEPTDAITLHWRGDPSDHPSQPAVPIFDDLNDYYNPANPMGSVIVPNTGTQIRVKGVSALGSFMQVEVRPSK
jgi:immune inhibitor A